MQIGVMDDRKYAILYKFSFITEIAIELIFWHLKKKSQLFFSPYHEYWAPAYVY